MTTARAARRQGHGTAVAEAVRVTRWATICSGTRQDGQPCRAPATESGLCAIHDPQISKSRVDRIIEPHLDKGTPLGRELKKRALEIDIRPSCAEIGPQIELSTGGARRLIYVHGTSAHRYIRENIARFLGKELSEVDALIRQGRGRPEGEVEFTCHYGPCNTKFVRSRSNANRSERHYCSWEHYRLASTGQAKYQGKRPKGRRASGRQRKAIVATRSKPSDRAVAEATGLHQRTVSYVRRGKQPPSPYVRFALEEHDKLERTEHPRLTERLLGFCLNYRMLPAELARTTGISGTALSYIFRRGGARPATLERLASAMSRLGDQITTEDLESLCDPGRYRNAKSLAFGLSRDAIKAGTVDIEEVVDKVLKKHPDVDETHIRRYVEGLIRKHRGPGAPLSFTDDDARKVRVLRDTEGLSWARIGELMAWPVIRTSEGYPSDCRRARNAHAYALRLGL